MVPGQSLYLPPGVHFPALDRLIPTAQTQPTTVGAESDAGHDASMTGQSVDFASSPHVPELHRLICARGGNPAPVRAEGNSANRLLVTAQLLYFLTAGYVRNRDCLVVIPGREQSPIWTKGHIDDRPPERGQDTYLAPCLHIPKPYGLIVYAGGQPLAVRTKGDRINEVAFPDAQRLVARERTDFLPRASVPQAYGVGGILGCQPASVPAEGNRLDFLHLATDGAQLFAGGHLPRLDALVPASRRESPPVRIERHRSDPAGVSFEGAVQQKIGRGGAPRGNGRRYRRCDGQDRRLHGGTQSGGLEGFKFSRHRGSLVPLHLYTLTVVPTVELQAHAVLARSKRRDSGLAV